MTVEPTWRCGHPRTLENTKTTYWDGTVRGQCRECVKARDRAKKARKRAAMTPEERAERRRENDARYRETHREQRRQYDRRRLDPKTPAA